MRGSGAVDAKGLASRGRPGPGFFGTDSRRRQPEMREEIINMKIFLDNPAGIPLMPVPVNGRGWPHYTKHPNSFNICHL